MTEPITTSSKTAATLRAEFDRSFTEAPMEVARFENMLAVRVGGDAYAIRLAEIAGLFADRCIVPFPTPMPNLLGMASFRGQLVPVYDLAAMLGYPPRAAARWLVLARGRHTVGLAFDMFEAQLTVPSERIVSATGAGNAREAGAYLRGAVLGEDALRPILDLPSVLDGIQTRAQTIQHATQSAKER